MARKCTIPRLVRKYAHFHGTFTEMVLKMCRNFTDWQTADQCITVSTQPCIPFEPLNRVPALIGCGKGGNITSAGNTGLWTGVMSTVWWTLNHSPLGRTDSQEHYLTLLSNQNLETTIGHDYHYLLLAPTKLSLLQQQPLRASSATAAIRGSLPLVWKAQAQLPVTGREMSRETCGLEV